MLLSMRVRLCKCQGSNVLLTLTLTLIFNAHRKVVVRMRHGRCEHVPHRQELIAVGWVPEAPVGRQRRDAEAEVAGVKGAVLALKESRI